MTDAANPAVPAADPVLPKRQSRAWAKFRRSPSALLGGVIVVEVLFAWPGLGRLTYDAVLARDYTVVQGAVLLVAAIFLVANLVVDLLYALIDPRIRYR